MPLTRKKPWLGAVVRTVCCFAATWRRCCRRIEGNRDMLAWLRGEMQNQAVPVWRANSREDLQTLLKTDRRGLILSMIHKFEGIEADANTRDIIYVFIDEAHRSVAKDLGTYLMAEVPNATIIGFTGTPIARTQYGEGTFKIFGGGDDLGYLDKYTIAESIKDETTLPICRTLACRMPPSCRCRMPFGKHQSCRICAALPRAASATPDALSKDCATNGNERLAERYRSVLTTPPTWRLVELTAAIAPLGLARARGCACRTPCRWPPSWKPRASAWSRTTVTSRRSTRRSSGWSRTARAFPNRIATGSYRPTRAPPLPSPPPRRGEGTGFNPPTRRGVYSLVC